MVDQPVTEDTFRMLLDAAPDAMLIVDEHGKIVLANNQTEALFGYQNHELLGRPVEFLLPERYRAQHLVHRNHFFGEPHRRPMGSGLELFGQRKDGCEFPVEVSLSPLLTKTGRVVSAAVRDITERKQAQLALQQAYDLLEARVKERTADLEAANEELRTFTYIVSHDLRAPLVNLKGFSVELRLALEEVSAIVSDLIAQLTPAQQETLRTALQEDIPEALNFIDSSVTRIDSLSSAVLKLSRLGHREFHLEPVDTTALVNETVKALAFQLEQRQAQVTIAPLPSVLADTTSMQQIFGNLIANAVVYLDPERPGQIEIAGERGQVETKFWIKDNGRGIARRDFKKIFEPFRRGSENEVPGEGMGLAYVQTLVRRHGGHVWCESVRGAGSTFFFTISNNLKTESQ